MKTLLFIVGIILLLETIFSKLIQNFGTNNSFLQAIRAFNENRKIMLTFISAGLLVSSFVLSELEKKDDEIRALEREKKILVLESEVKGYKSKLNEAKAKLNEANSIIKDISITYSVGFEVNEMIFSDRLILGPSVIYGMLGSNVHLKSNGVTFRFIQTGQNKYIVECNAALMDGDFPHGSNIDMFKNYRALSIFIPFLRNRSGVSNFIVSNYTILLKINGVQVSPIIEFKRRQYPITGGAYSDERQSFGTIVHQFTNNLYDDLHLKNHLINF